MPKNYYIILGIPVSSTQDDIKSAYRRLAKEYHPDYYGNNQTPFQMIHEAYSVLGDPARRRNYDSHLQDRTVPRQPMTSEHTTASQAQTQAEPLIPEQWSSKARTNVPDRSIHQYNSLFDGLFDRMLSGFHEDRHPQFINNSTIEVQLTSDQATRGGNLRIEVPMRIRCPNCNSSGHHALYGCWRCNGSGYLAGGKQLVLSYPAGVQSGHTIQLPVTRVDDRNIQLTAIIRIYEKT